MKLRISPYRTIVSFLVAALVVAAILFGVFWSVFLEWPWGWEPITLIVVWAVSTIVFLIITLVNSYYIVERKYVEVKRIGKSLIYNYDDVIYIDEEKSKKKKTVYFYTRQGHSRYMTFDRKGVLYEVMLEKCKNRLSKEDFYRLHPDAKL